MTAQGSQREPFAGLTGELRNVRTIPLLQSKQHMDAGMRCVFFAHRTGGLCATVSLAGTRTGRGINRKRLSCLRVISSGSFHADVHSGTPDLLKWEEECPMKSTDHKKIFRADTEQENKKQLNQSEKRKIIAVCAAVAAIAVIFSGVGCECIERMT